MEIMDLEMDELSTLERIQAYCKRQPFCGLCMYAGIGFGCLLNNPGRWDLKMLEKETEMKKEAEKND